MVYVTAIIILLWLLTLVFLMFVFQVAAFKLAVDIIVFLGFIVLALIVAFSVIFFTTFYLGFWTTMFTRLQREVHFSKAHRSLRHLTWIDKKII